MAKFTETYIRQTSIYGRPLVLCCEFVYVLLHRKKPWMLMFIYYTMKKIKFFEGGLNGHHSRHWLITYRSTSKYLLRLQTHTTSLQIQCRLRSLNKHHNAYYSNQYNKPLLMSLRSQCTKVISPYYLLKEACQTIID